MSYTNMPKRHIKILLGAISSMYDDVQHRMGLDPQKLREIAEQFKSNCYQVEDDIYQGKS